MGGKPFCWTTYSEGGGKRGRNPPHYLRRAHMYVSIYIPYKKKKKNFFFVLIFICSTRGGGELENFKTEFQLPSSLTYTNNTLYIYYLIAGPFLDKEKKKKKKLYVWGNFLFIHWDCCPGCRGREGGRGGGRGVAGSAERISFFPTCKDSFGVKRGGGRGNSEAWYLLSCFFIYLFIFFLTISFTPLSPPPPTPLYRIQKIK